MAKAKAFVNGSCVVIYPQGADVGMNFNVDGDATGESIAAVSAKNAAGVLVKPPVRWQVINEPSSDGGAWLISVTMPATATAAGDPYTLTVVDSDGNPGQGSFNL